jgi:two-component system nitrogen regulation sensor histidine kinase NtrY
MRVLRSPVVWAFLLATLTPIGLVWLALRLAIPYLDRANLAADLSTLLGILAAALCPIAIGLGAFFANRTHATDHREPVDVEETLARTQRQLLRAERIAAWRDIARRIAHEIKNPLQPIQMSIETLRKTRAQNHPEFDAIFEETTLTILEETQRLERIVSEFSRFARLPRPRPMPMQLVDVAESVVTLLREDGVQITLNASQDLPEIRADREQLTQVVMNLVQNAKDAVDKNGTISLTASKLGTDHVELIVQDSGHGVPADLAPQIFDPYLTTKPHGTGLGLAIAFRIVGDHQGTLELLTHAPEGAAFKITLPIKGPPIDASASTSEALGLLMR